jgi:hypothetical protein
MNRFKLVFSLFMLVALFSCEKDLDILPTDTINEENVFLNVSDLVRGLYGVYGSIPGGNDMYINALVSDEVKLSNENRGQGQFEFKWQYVAASGGAASDVWNNYYYVIGLANKTLAAAPKISASSPADQAARDAIVGELLAIRAFAHFQILQCFSGKYDPNKSLGIPYTTTSDISAKPSRISVGAVVSAIEADLEKAANTSMPNAPVADENAGFIRLSKATVAGIRARVALYKASGLDDPAEWNKAITYAQECITKSGKSLSSGSAYSSIWTDADPRTSEVLFKLRRTNTSVGTLWQDNNGDVFFEPSDKLKSLFNRTTDRRFPLFISATVDDTCLVNKFFTSSRGAKIVDVKMMRISEMYLIMAEAYAGLNNLTNAAKFYNDLRTIRIIGYIPETFFTKAEAISKIYDERARELCFEGFRYFDHIRRGLSIDRINSDVQSSNWKNLSSNDFRMLFPVPQTSTNANPNMIQNPGY